MKQGDQNELLNLIIRLQVYETTNVSFQRNLIFV